MNPARYQPSARGAIIVKDRDVGDGTSIPGRVSTEFKPC